MNELHGGARSRLVSLFGFGFGATSLGVISLSLSAPYANVVWAFCFAYSLLTVAAVMDLLNPARCLPQSQAMLTSNARRMIRVSALLVPVPLVLLLFVGEARTRQLMQIEATQKIDVQAQPLYSVMDRDYAESDYVAAEAACRRLLLLHESSGGPELICDYACLGTILDGQRRYAEAEDNYEKAENNYFKAEKACQDARYAVYARRGQERISTFGGEDQLTHRRRLPMGRIVYMCTGRALKLLTLTTEQNALQKFGWAAQVLEQRRLPLHLRLSVTKIDLRCIVRDFREVRPLRKTVAIVPVSANLTYATGLNSLGVVLTGSEIRRYLAKIGRHRALSDFEFAAQVLPVKGGAYKELMSANRYPGANRFPKSLQDATPNELYILCNDDVEDLQRICGSLESDATEENARTVYEPGES